MKRLRHVRPNLLEINAFLFMERMRRKHGPEVTLGTVPKSEWEGLAQKGFGLIWLMGVWERSPGSRECALAEDGLKQAYAAALPGWTDKDVKGSPYAVHSYALDGNLGAEDDLLRVRETLNDLGMSLILDFVPNHTALDHPWTRSNPEVFVQGTWEDLQREPALFFKTGSDAILAHGKDPYFPAWLDTAQIDYFSAAARTALLEELKCIARYADGLRCDMAMLALNEVFAKIWEAHLHSRPRPENEFWADAIQEVRGAYPDFLFMAEAYWDIEYRLQQLGFDYTYDKRLYDLLLQTSAREAKGHLLGEINYQKKCIRFIENHDEPRAASAFGKERSCAAAVVMATVPGLHLFHEGQMEGNTVRVPVQLSRMEEEAPDPSLRDFYDRLLAFTAGEPLGSGTWIPLDIRPAWEGNLSAGNLLAWIWQDGNKLKLVCVNYSGAVSQGRLRIPPAQIQAGPLTFRDVLTDEIYVRTTDEIIGGGLFVELGPWKSHLLDLLS